jgi:branched-chain amino acid transport system substrate-binding protein
MRIGEGYITGLMVQWQKGNPVTVWPASVATGKMTFPAFTKLPE